MWKLLPFIETRKHILNSNLNVRHSYISVIFQIPRAMLHLYLFSFQTMPLLCWMTGQSNVSFVRNIMDGRKEIQKVSQGLDNWLSIQLEWMNGNCESHSNRFWSCHQDMLIPSLKTFESNNHVFLNPIVSFLHFYLCFLQHQIRIFSILKGCHCIMISTNDDTCKAHGSNDLRMIMNYI